MSKPVDNAQDEGPKRRPDGTFVPGSGGRPRGARRKTTQLAEEMLTASAPDIIQAAIDRAIEGDATALKVCMDRIAPVRKGAPVEVALPTLKGASDVPAAIAKLLQAVGAGELSPDEAQSVASLVEAGRKAIEMTDIEARLAALEAQQPK